MEAETLIELAYREFSCFEKPEHSTNYNHCLECAEYAELLYNVSRENLSIQQIGTELWGPVAFLVPEALAYYLPRLIELAIRDVKNKHGESFTCQFLNQIGTSSQNDKRFSCLNRNHKEMVYRCFEFLRDNQGKKIEEEFCDDWLYAALENWRT